MVVSLPYIIAMSLSGCCGAEDKSEETRRSKMIDLELSRERNCYRNTHRLLLFGAGESGKSTIFKQMQIINMKGFTFDDRLKFIPEIYKNIRDAIYSLLNAMNILIPPIYFDKIEHIDTAKYLQNNTNNISNDLDYNNDFFVKCQTLWKSQPVQDCYARSNEFQMIDSAKYFLDKISTIIQEGYLPNDQDILRCRILTTQIKQIKFKIKDALFHMFDVGGQRNQRYKWIQCFNDATAIVFVAAISEFNQTLREDEDKNRFQESLDLFRNIWTNRFLEDVSVILFLNKTDLLYEKVLACRFKIEDYFPCYKDYQTIKANKKEYNSEPLEFIRAKSFFKDCFLSIAKQHVHRRTSKSCYPHFTCALDTDHMRRIFEDCRIAIQKEHLDRFGILPVDR